MARWCGICMSGRCSDGDGPPRREMTLPRRRLRNHSARQTGRRQSGRDSISARLGQIIYALGHALQQAGLAQKLARSVATRAARPSPNPE